MNNWSRSNFTFFDASGDYDKVHIMYKKAQEHFKNTDPLLYKESLQFVIENITVSENLYRNILKTIVNQQLSGKVADTIFGRFEKLFPKTHITPERTLKLSDDELRKAGLSNAKMKAIRNVAQKVINKELDLKTLPTLSDELIIEELIKIKGIGPWTAEMLLMFSLGRMDVFSMGDLVLRNELMRLYGLKKLPSEKKLREIFQKWSPYKTYAAKILWKIADEKKRRQERLGDIQK